MLCHCNIVGVTGDQLNFFSVSTLRSMISRTYRGFSFSDRLDVTTLEVSSFSTGKSYMFAVSLDFLATFGKLIEQREVMQGAFRKEIRMKNRRSETPSLRSG